MLAKYVFYHSLPARILHWLNSALLGLLITTGLYINNPALFPFFINMDMARKIHFIAMYLLIYGLIIRVYYSWVSGDYKNFLLKFREILDLPKVVAYYLFLSKTAPEYERYNPAQKLLYLVWAILIIIQAITGFAIYKPMSAGKFFYFAGTPVFMRQVHLLITWFFIITAALHVYLALISGWQTIKSMIVDENSLNIKRKTHKLSRI